MTPIELEKLLEELVLSASANPRSYFLRDRLFTRVTYDDLTKDAKGFLAKYFLKESCSGIGSSKFNNDLPYFLSQFANELDAAPNYEPFGMRKQEHVAFAIRLLTEDFSAQNAGVAVGAFYLERVMDFCKLGQCPARVIPVT